jgi:hypothetical protein
MTLKDGPETPSTGKQSGIWSNASPTFVAKGVTFDKTERYGWKTIDEPGELQWLDKTTLSVAHELYQRSVDNPAKVDKIASEWSWMACGVLIVALRQNGTLYVVDGQNRLVAALKRSDIRSLPCLLFAVDTPAAEASAFSRINRNRKLLSRTDLFRSDVVAGHPESVRLRDLLDRYGYVVGNPGTKRAAACVDALLGAMRNDESALRSVLDIYDKQLDGGRMLAQMVDGLMYLHNSGVDLDDKRLRKRLADVGYDELISSIRKTSEFRGKGTKEAFAEGIQLAVNKGLRNHVIQWPRP